MTTARLVTAALLLAVSSAAVAGSAPGGPAFDCRKASTAVEKKICATPALAASDRRVATLFRAYQPNLLTPQQKTLVHGDQVAWLKERDACGADAACLATAYQQRIERLQGRSGALPLAGSYEIAKIGSLTLFPLGGRYLASLQTAQPDDGHWTCEFEGFATPQGTNLLAFESTDGSTRFETPVTGHDAIAIPDTPQAAQASAALCGAGGSIQFNFTRVPVR